jgi:hypothetical protein
MNTGLDYETPESREDMKFILIPSVSWKMFGRVGDLIDK